MAANSNVSKSNLLTCSVYYPLILTYPIHLTCYSMEKKRRRVDVMHSGLKKEEKTSHLFSCTLKLWCATITDGLCHSGWKFVNVVTDYTVDFLQGNTLCSVLVLANTVSNVNGANKWETDIHLSWHLGEWMHLSWHHGAHSLTPQTETLWFM